jgi:hypothetical protein
MYKTEAHNSSRVLMIKWHCFIQNAYMVVATTSATSAVVKSVMSQGHWCLSQEAALSTLRILILPCLSSRSKWETLPGSAASLGWILTHTPSNHNLKIKNGDSSAVLGLFKITLTMLRFLFYFVSIWSLFFFQISVKNTVGIWMAIVFNLLTSFGRWPFPQY